MRHARWLVVSLLLTTLGCQRSVEQAWQRNGALPALATMPFDLSEFPAGAALRVAHMRPVLVQRRTVLRQHLLVSAPGPQEIEIPESALRIDGPSVDAQVRDQAGSVSVRPASLRHRRSRPVISVELSAADVGKSLDLTVTANVAWSPLRVQTEPFVIPNAAHLRFCIGVAALDVDPPPAPMGLRVSLELPTGAVAVLHEAELPPPRQAHADVVWTDVDVDLAAHGGQTARLVLESQAEVSRGGPPFELLPLISEPVLMTEAPRGQRRNVVLISIDTLRADHLGAYGYARATSPRIDGLAAGGTVLTNAFATWPETSASHMTLFTSLYPSVHGVGMTHWGARALPPWQRTLAELLRQNGYQTGAITEDGLLAQSLGFGRGFADYVEFRTAATLFSASAVADRVFDAGAQWLHRHRNETFFLFLHTYQVHERAAPATYDALRERFGQDGIAAVDARGTAMMREYDVAIRYTDDLLAPIVRALDELQLTDKTLLIVTSDHGEEFGTHKAYGHGSNLSDYALHVPLILRCPAFVPAGKRIPTPVGLIDLLPTLLDLLQLPAAPQAQGRSFAAAVTGQAQLPQEPLVGELAEDIRSVRYADYKVVWKSGATAAAEYYDLQQDPGEIEARPDLSGRIDAALVRLHEHDRESTARRERLAAGAGGASNVVPVPLDPATREHLRALGYEVPQQ